jgi:hypothetical protein
MSFQPFGTYIPTITWQIMFSFKGGETGKKSDNIQLRLIQMDHLQLLAKIALLLYSIGFIFHVMW